jgi:flagellar biosynthesis protein FlhF
MQIRSFQAPTMIEAVSKVKAALGPDALVLSTRTVRKGEGWFGLLGRPMVEVTAAIDRDLAPPPPERASRASTRERARPDASWTPLRAQHAQLGSLAEEIRSLRSQVQGLSGGGAAQSETLRELAELRAFTSELARGRAPTVGGPLEARLAGRLLASGLSPRHAFLLGRDAATRPEVGQTERAALRAALRSRFDGRMQPPRPDDGVEVEILVGPTGVGKTTTVAKLAAREERENGGVALLTTDTHRLGAVEQLRHYAASLGVPFGVAGDADELAELIHARPAGRVLVDTAGRGADADAVESLVALRRAAGRRVRVSLVLAATAHDDQLRAERLRYAPVAPDALILTKLDECATWSPAANLVLDDDAPQLSWMAAGQRVPEDLTIPEPQAFADALLRTEEAA